MTKTYKLPMSLEDWQCYLDTPQEVVDLINTYCEKALKRSKDPKSALFNVYTVLNDFVEFGLRDTECDLRRCRCSKCLFKDEPDVDRYSVGFVSNNDDREGQRKAFRVSTEHACIGRFGMIPKQS